jgi:hypothetical protein
LADQKTVGLKWAAASGDGEVARRSAQVDQSPKPAEVKSGDDVRRADESIPVHRHQEFPHRLLGPEEIGEDRAVPTERLLPAVGPLANRVFKVAPHFPQYGIRVVDIAGHS